MNILSRYLILMFLGVQKFVQRFTSIEFTRRLSSWVDWLFSVPKTVEREKFIQYERACEWLRPQEISSGCVILYIHGGFVFPLYNPTRYLAGCLAKMASRPALLVGFRLAPEHPFPAALEDCKQAYRWLISEGNVLPEQVIFVGESAGGNLAITSALSLRDAGDPLPAGLVLISPVVDFEGRGSFYTQSDRMADANFVMLQLDAYRGNADPRDPLLAPIYAELEGLPPLLIQVGAEEFLRDGAQELALRAQGAGVPTTLEIWPGMWHYWHIFYPALPEAREAMQNIVDFLKSPGKNPEQAEQRISDC